MSLIKDNIPNIRLNIDPIEIDKFGYHNGILFKFYSKNFNELFSGGRYNVNDENCIGFSALIENLIKEFDFSEKKYKKIFIPMTEKNVDRVELLNKKFLIVGIGINLIKSPKIKNYPTTNLYELTNKKIKKEKIEQKLKLIYENFIPKLQKLNTNTLKKI